MIKATNTQNNKRIAKNTLLLYIRLLITMAINIYTSRVILNTLGVDDYGVYNIVAGIIVLFSFINSSMSSATSRFITFELGKPNDEQNLQNVFSTSCTIHVVIAFIVLILAETIGLYLLNNKLVIPESRKIAATIIYQVSIIMVVINILQTPYTASIFAHEKMNIYASTEIINSTLKLIIAIILPFFLYDKLIIYVVLLLVSSIIIFSIYVIYCHRKLNNCRFMITWDKKYLKPMSTFSGWDLYGNMSTIARTQGVNLLLNVFFGPAMNAANGIAIQVQGAVNTFATNLLLAVRPQIVKSYAKKDINYTFWLLENTVKLTTILLFVLCFPLIAEMPFILKIWLVSSPHETIIFAQLTLTFIIFANISLCLISVLHAIGQIKKPSIINGTIYLIVIPLTYLAFKLGFPPYVPFILNILFIIIGGLLNIFYIKQSIGVFSVWKFVRNCIIPTLFIAIISAINCSIIIHFLHNGWERLIIIILTNMLLNITLAYLLILDKEMKDILNNKVKEYVNKKTS